MRLEFSAQNFSAPIRSAPYVAFLETVTCFLGFLYERRAKLLQMVYPHDSGNLHIMVNIDISEKNMVNIPTSIIIINIFL